MLRDKSDVDCRRDWHLLKHLLAMWIQVTADDFWFVSEEDFCQHQIKVRGQQNDGLVSAWQGNLERGAWVPQSRSHCTVQDTGALVVLVPLDSLPRQKS